MSINNKTTFNQKQAARYLNISTSFLKQKRLDGAGPAYSRVGKRVIYCQEDLDSFLQKHRVETTG